MVPHRGTNWAALWLTAQIRRDAVLSESYGRGWLIMLTNGIYVHQVKVAHHSCTAFHLFICLAFFTVHYNYHRLFTSWAFTFLEHFLRYYTPRYMPIKLFVDSSEPTAFKLSCNLYLTFGGFLLYMHHLHGLP